MRIPASPPELAGLLMSLDHEQLQQVIAQAGSPLPTGRYLHWDELRRREPPAGLTCEMWWTGVGLARLPMMQKLPLLDKRGEPFQFATPSPVLIDLYHIDRDAAGQIQNRAGAPVRTEPERYLLGSLIEEAITSSQLEGAATTRKAAAAMLRAGRKPRDHGETMIFNNYRAMEQLRSIKGEALTPELILEIHRLLTEGTLDDPADVGTLRKSDEIRIVDRRDETVLHQPPSHRELPQRLERLCAFANADESSLPFVHPVLRAILLHFMIGYDHPFEDGNGRTARALYYWSMARSGYWLMEYTSISHILRKAPAKYMRAYLHTETDNNDTTYFLLHQLATIRMAIAALHDYVARKSSEQKQTERLLSGSARLRTRFNHRQVALLTHALKNSGEAYRVDAHQRSHGVVYQTARSDLLDLESSGLLERQKQGNAYVFFAPDDLRRRIEQMSA
jgi:Fic family protein